MFPNTTFCNNGIYICNLNYVLVVLCAARILDLSFSPKKKIKLDNSHNEIVSSCEYLWS